MVYQSAQLNVSATAFYNYILSMIAEDVKSATGQTVSAEKIKQGFTYVKKMKARTGVVENVDVVVSELVKDTAYTAHFTSSMGTNVTSYHIKVMNETDCKVTAGEGFTYDATVDELAYKQPNPLAKFVIKSNQKTMLKAIEKNIKSEH